MNLKYKFFIVLLMPLLVGVSLVNAEVSPGKPGAVAKEYIGGLSAGMTRSAAFKYLAIKPVLNEIAMSQMTGEMYQAADFAAVGVQLVMTSESETGPQIVDSITVAAPSTLSTKKGIHIGSTEAEVMAAYKGQSSKDSGESGERVFVQFKDEYGSFEIEQGRVVSMSIGFQSEMD